MEHKLNGTVIVTYRCNARCSMCYRHQDPSLPQEELSLDTIRKLPRMYFTNITGGEPFLRKDLKEIVRILQTKSDRIVISTNGYFTARIIDLAKEFPNVGIRISIEGMESSNDKIRGLEHGYQRAWQTLQELKALGLKDIGLAMTIQDENYPDLNDMYRLSCKNNMEFATAAVHNSFYFNKADNEIQQRGQVSEALEELVCQLLQSSSPKKWFRAYFNHGLISYVYDQPRLLPCGMGRDAFFLDPYGDVIPCNGSEEKWEI